ncbi:PREP1 [Symbiodinium sp. CCMP2592]|nr:PREP1 [Symbiodinium sp. CCMP2592]
MSELHKLISGHNLNVMFQDTRKEDAMIAAVAAPRGANTTEMLAFQAHVKAMLKDGGYYALPTSILPDGSTQYLLVQFVSSKPEAKKYMEKILQWGQDMWHEQAAVTTLGSVVVQPQVTLLDDIPSDALVPLPANATASVGTVGTMEPVSIAGLFKYGFEHVYEFQDVGHVCEVSEEAVNNAIEDDEEEPELEEALCTHVSIAGDPLRMQAVFEVCKQALQTGLPLAVSEDSRESVDWLVSHDLAARTLDGRMVLLSSCMRNVTHLASPVLLTHPEDDSANSTWGLRKKLCEQGWTSGVASAASARDKIFNSKNPAKSYYCLLLRCFDDVCRWEEQRAFSHSVLCSGYYDAVSSAIDKVAAIPKNMTAKGYVQLASFFQGERQTDPREEKLLFRCTAKQGIRRHSTRVQPNAKRKASSKKRALEAQSEPAPAPPPIVIEDDDDEQQPTQGALLPAALLTEGSLSCLGHVSDPEPIVAAAVGPPAGQSEPAGGSSAVPVPPIAARRQQRPPPVDIERKVFNDGHRLVVSLVLPHLRAIMLDPETCSLQPRQQVHRALVAVDLQGDRFWGANETYSRKRTVEDLVLNFYFDEVKRAL